MIDTLELHEIKPHVAFCDGGLSNRLNVLVFALVLRMKYGGKWNLAWPVNNWCGSRFDDLFNIDMTVVDCDLNHYKSIEEEYFLLMHENQANFNNDLIIFHSNLPTLENYRNIILGSKPVFYYHHLIPKCANLEDLKKCIGQIEVRSSVRVIAENFCSTNGIDSTVLGLHIRKTDFGNAVDDISLYEMVCKSPLRFFVCSDDESVNHKFAQLSNCIVYEKKSFPTRMIMNSDWNEATVDDQGRVFNFNINRSAESITDALVDLLILSRTTHILTSHSTFLQMSMLFKSTGFF